MSFQEIADVIGCSPQAVYQSYVNGLRKLRKQPERLAKLIDLATMREKFVQERSAHALTEEE